MQKNFNNKNVRVFTQPLRDEADSLNIPYDDDTSMVVLRDAIDDYKLLLEQVETFDIDWDMSEYDPVGLQQEIDEYKSNSYLEMSDLRTEYHDNLRVS